MHLYEILLDPSTPVLYAKSTAGIVFRDNKVTATPSSANPQKAMFILNGDKDMVVRENLIKKASAQNFEFRNMEKRHLNTDLRK